MYSFPSTEYDIYRSQKEHSIDFAHYALREGDTIVAVLSYGKVGSSAVCHSIEHIANAECRPLPVYHLHSFERSLPPHDDIADIPPHHLSGSALRAVFDAARDRFQWRFINGVRDPVTMLISGYFENNFLSAGAPEVDDIRRYAKTFVPWVQSHADREYRGNVGVDLYSTPFDRDAGYSLIRCENVHVLTYRVDRLSEIFQDAMVRLLDKTGLTLKTFNASVEKDVVVDGVRYADSFRRMREEFTLPPDMLDAILAHPSVTHFYSKDEIAGFRNRWVDRTGAALQLT